MRDQLLTRKKGLRIAFILLCFSLIALPLLVHMLKIEKNATAVENRVLAEYPGKPKSKQDWLQFTARFDRYLDDHFGMRQTLVQWNQRWRYAILKEAVSPQITVGKDGYLFFNAHEAHHPLRMLEFICGKNISDQQAQELAQEVNSFAQFARQTNSSTTIAFVPSKPALYGEYLPSWWQQECARYQPTLLRVMSTLQQQNGKPQVVYPLNEMRAAKQFEQLYPLHDFHWQGKGAQRYAQIIAEQVWGRKANTELPFVTERSPSDMQSFMPGVDLAQNLQKPDWDKSAFAYCEGPHCFTELAHATILGDVTRMQRRQTASGQGQRLLLITDSFGHGVAPYFAPYFDEVWHVSSNNTGALNAEQKQQLKQSLEKFAPSQTLYLFHDFALSCFSQQLKYCPLELPPVLREVHPILP
jgi:hypothetical protein